MAGKDIDELLNRAVSECPGYHVELAGWGRYYWPWRQWPEFTERAEAVEFKKKLAHAAWQPGDVAELRDAGSKRLCRDGAIVPRERSVAV